MALHSVKPKFSRYTKLQPDFIVVDSVDVNAAARAAGRKRRSTGCSTGCGANEHL
ncbi:hypothetical protein LTSERUB_4385 [Salmonella enterica subsp. enterica serovar Rubislaw str. A4-653]|uniref:Fe/B12 periplasmic-binding domain-containing protein n=1 Tax=Salmonella enterica subsp. enterica serovar Rubislaw str. A4-653 TaxID=913081 RepID=G5QN78_SALRU|nr:hypothetical protein LTSERUB_4385 [Salmonella enterica subsp. enterica serovar Rubislaw str. A4-653]